MSRRRSSVAAGSGQRAVAHVVLEVEVGVVDPHRTAEVHGDEAHSLAVARHERQLACEELHEAVIGRGWSFEDRARADVHVGDAVLEVEERRVERVHAIHDGSFFVSFTTPLNEIAR